MCESCAKVRDSSRKVRSSLKTLTADYPLQVVSTDIAGPLVVSDNFSRLGEILPIPWGQP